MYENCIISRNSDLVPGSSYAERINKADPGTKNFHLDLLKIIYAAAACPFKNVNSKLNLLCKNINAVVFYSFSKRTSIIQ